MIWLKYFFFFSIDINLPFSEFTLLKVSVSFLFSPLFFCTQLYWFSFFFLKGHQETLNLEGCRMEGMNSFPPSVDSSINYLSTWYVIADGRFHLVTVWFSINGEWHRFFNCFILAELYICIIHSESSWLPHLKCFIRQYIFVRFPNFKSPVYCIVSDFCLWN